MEEYKRRTTVVYNDMLELLLEDARDDLGEVVEEQTRLLDKLMDLVEEEGEIRDSIVAMESLEDEDNENDEEDKP